MSPAGGPLEEDHVVLSCKADKLIYGNLTWFLVTNASEAEPIASVQPCRPWWNVTALKVPVVFIFMRLFSQLADPDYTFRI